MSQSLVDILQDIRRAYIQGIAKTVDHAKAWTAFAELDQRDVVPVNSSTQSQICLAPFAFGAQAAKGLPECLIYVQVLAQ